MSIQTFPRISVCVCTYKRPQLLGKLLDSLHKQSFPLNEFEVVVVDNDKLGSARRAVDESMQLRPALEISYDIEPVQGISYARNRTVALARGELLAFIDDDECANPSWLLNLVHTMDACDADAVLGPVLPLYPAATSAWVIRSGFFDRPRFVSGTVIRSEACRTGNALVMAGKVKSRQPKPFDDCFAQTGGEDQDLFRWLEDQGCRFVWCDQAVVQEEVPEDRLKLGYMLKRGLRGSSSYWQIINQKRSRARAFGEAILGIGIGLIFAVWGILVIPAGLHRTVRKWLVSAKGFGRVIALTEYKLTGYR